MRLRLSRARPAGGGDAAFCKACCYDLTALAAFACPECGSPFDPADPTTFDPIPRDRVLRRRIRRTAIAALCIALAVMMSYHSILPRPLSTSQPFVWVWMGRSFGREFQDIGPSMQARVHWFNDSIRGVDIITGHGKSRATAATLRRNLDAGTWSLDVLIPDMDLPDLLAAIAIFTSPDEYLGIAIPRFAPPDPDDPGPIATGPAPHTVPETLSITGTRDEMLSSLLRASGATDDIQPILFDDATGLVWVWSADADALARVSLDRAVELGYTPELQPRPRPREIRPPARREGW